MIRPICKSKNWTSVRSYRTHRTDPVILREFVEMAVHALDKSSGHRVQRIDVHYTFIGKIDLSPEYSKYKKETTA